MTPDPTSRDFADLRKRVGLSVSECADLLGVDERTIRRWEADPALVSSRDPHPTALRVLLWIASPGRPKAWPKAPAPDGAADGAQAPADGQVG